MAAGPQDAQDHPGPGLAGVPDARSTRSPTSPPPSAPRAQQKEFNACNRDIVARGRAPGIIPVEATQRPSADIIPTSLRDLFGYRWAFRCSTEASSDTILGHGWANMGYSATEIDPQARGVSWLRAEDGIPRRVKAAYLTDEEIIDLADWAAQARATHHATAHAARRTGTWSGCTARVMPHDRPPTTGTAARPAAATRSSPTPSSSAPARCTATSAGLRSPGPSSAYDRARPPAGSADRSPAA